MKRTTLLIVLLAPAIVLSQTTPAQSVLSPAERSMAAAHKLIDKNTKNFEAYNALALALSRRARETSDPAYYTQAEDALKKSFEISPNNFDGERTAVWLLLGKHEFAAALDKAKELRKKMPDDVMLYGFLTDANVELGNYSDAENAAQWMLDLRPGNLPGMTRAAYLRELFGDLDGSLELMNMAYQSTPPHEVEDRAWILSQIGHLQLMSGKITEADNTLKQALTIFPGYHYALGNLAKVRIEQKRYEDAVDLLQQRYRAAAHVKSEGFPIEFVNRWHVEVGPLHIWIASGRWQNAETRERGRICKRTMRDLVAPIFEWVITQGRHLCPEQEHRAKQEPRRHQEFLAQHKQYMNRLTYWRPVERCLG